MVLKHIIIIFLLLTGVLGTPCRARYKHIGQRYLFSICLHRKIAPWNGEMGSVASKAAPEQIFSISALIYSFRFKC